MKGQRALRAALSGLLALACSALHAGSVEGPYLIWMNLAPPHARHADADIQIKTFVDGDDRLCWPEGALLFMRARPPGVTAALVRRALEHREPAAQERLRMLLRKPFEDVPAFDGVVAYSERGAPSLLALPMTGRVRSEALRSATGEDAWGATFCRVMPPISRLP
jgi:hypothetical protein